MIINSRKQYLITIRITDLEVRSLFSPNDKGIGNKM